MAALEKEGRRWRREETIGWPAALLFQAAARGFEDTGGGWGGVEVDGQTRPCTQPSSGPGNSISPDKCTSVETEIAEGVSQNSVELIEVAVGRAEHRSRTGPNRILNAFIFMARRPN